MEATQETKPEAKPIRLKLKTGQSLYRINKVTGGLIEKCNEDIVYIDKVPHVKPKPDMFYFGAKNLVNAKFILEGYLEKVKEAIEA